MFFLIFLIIISTLSVYSLEYVEYSISSKQFASSNTADGTIYYVRSTKNQILLSIELSECIVYNYNMESGIYNNIPMNQVNYFKGATFPTVLYDDNSLQYFIFPYESNSICVFDYAMRNNTYPVSAIDILTFTAKALTEEIFVYIGMMQGSDNKIKYGIGYMNNYSTIESNETFSARKMIDFDIFIPYDKSNVSFVLLDKYPQIMYCFIYLNLDKTTYKTLTFEISQTIFHFENIALEDGTFIFCYSEDTTNKDIYCGTMSFLSGEMNIDNSPVLIISNSEIGDAYFSMYKLGINRVILGVGKQNLYFSIIDKSMQFSAWIILI